MEIVEKLGIKVDWIDKIFREIEKEETPQVGTTALKLGHRLIRFNEINTWLGI